MGKGLAVLDLTNLLFLLIIHHQEGWLTLPDFVMAPSVLIYIGPFGAMVSIWALPCILGHFDQVLLLPVVQLDADQSFNENMMVMVMVMHCL